MKIAVLGPGSWGLTISWLLESKTDKLYLWGLPEFIEPIKQNRNVEKPVKVNISENIILTTNIREACIGADLIMLAIPSDSIREVAIQLKNIPISNSSIVINLAKGFELPSLLRMSEVLNQELPNNPIATLSGPTLAKEILEGKPTAAVVASEDEWVSEFVQKALSSDDLLRLYTNNDIIGVELGGSLKNVIAIATGFAYSLELGHNSIGSIITRGLAEIVRISVAMGANPSTLYGLSGIGDLVATCNSPNSRNYQVGYALAKNESLSSILANLGAVAEGVRTAEAVYHLSQKYRIDTPLCNEVRRLLNNEINPKEAISNMMKRQLKPEDCYKLH